jgi:hypothetical protein
VENEQQVLDALAREVRELQLRLVVVHGRHSSLRATAS